MKLKSISVIVPEEDANRSMRHVMIEAMKKNQVQALWLLDAHIAILANIEDGTRFKHSITKHLSRTAKRIILHIKLLLQ